MTSFVRRMIAAGMALGLALGMAVAFEAAPQSRTVQEAPTATVKPMTAQISPSMMKKAEPVYKIFEAGPSQPVVAGTQLMPRPTTPPKYTCTSTSCSCAGSYDCVKMIAADEKCDESTVGCNDSGCTCSPAN